MQADMLTWRSFTENSKKMELALHFIKECHKNAIHETMFERLAKLQLSSLFHSNYSSAGSTFDEIIAELMRTYPRIGIQFADERTEQLKRTMNVTKYDSMISWLRTLRTYYDQMGWIQNGKWQRLLTDLCAAFRGKPRLIDIHKDSIIQYQMDLTQSSQMTQSSMSSGGNIVFVPYNVFKTKREVIEID